MSLGQCGERFAMRPRRPWRDGEASASCMRPLCVRLRALSAGDAERMHLYGKGFRPISLSCRAPGPQALVDICRRARQSSLFESAGGISQMERGVVHWVRTTRQGRVR